MGVRRVNGAKVKVKFLKSMAGVDHSFAAGEVCEIPARQAAGLHQGGVVEIQDSAYRATVERATKGGAPEKAVRRP